MDSTVNTSFISRLQVGYASDYVQLDGEELDIYRGCGLMYAAVNKQGRIVEIRDCVTDSARYVTEDEAIEAAGCVSWCYEADCMLSDLIDIARYEAYQEFQQWKSQKVAEGHEVWKGMFSCTQLCDPFRRA